VREGDLVQHEGRAWLVRRSRENELSVTLQDAQGRNLEVTSDLDQTGVCQVVANPAAEWPFVVVRDNVKGKFMVRVSRTVGMSVVPLTMYVDWVPSDPARPGGPVFLNPALGVRPAETLLISWQNGSSTSLHIPVHFGTVGQRIERAARKKPPEVTVYDRLLDDRFDDEDA
jgi:hypothetical protein